MRWQANPWWNYAFGISTGISLAVIFGSVPTALSLLAPAIVVTWWVAVVALALKREAS